MKLALFKNKVYCVDCVFLFSIKDRTCKVVNGYTLLGEVFWRDIENHDGKCRFYKGKK